MKQDYIVTYYRPMLRKTFEAAVTNFVTREFPFLQGTMIVTLFVKELKKIVEAYYPPIPYLRPGQMVWVAVDKKEKLGYKKTITETKIRPVVLTILDREDILKYMNRVPLDQIQRDAWARLLLEADEQGAVLSEIDISTIFKVYPDLISKGVRAYEKEHQTILPRRGTIHDLGRSVSHKATICRKKLTENKSTSQIAQETHHTPEAVDRYLKGLSQVIFCTERGMSIKDTSFITSMSEGLVKQYTKLAKSLKPDKINCLKHGSDGKET